MLNGVQLARAVAAYAVVIYHIACELSYKAGFDAAPFIVGKGGVDLFFVISGFIMVHITRAHETPTGFFIKRVFRIVPLYWLATTAVLVLVAIRPWLVQPALVTPETLAASYFFFPMFDNNMEARPILFLGWTLNYEMMFYALFALALTVPRALRVPTVITLMLAVMVLAPLIPHQAAALFYSQPIMLEFVAGCLIGAVLGTRQAATLFKRVPVWPVTLLGIAGFALAATQSGALPRHLLYGIPAALVVFGLAAQDLYRTPLRASWLSRLGDASYSLYLLHILVFTVLSLAWFPLLGTGPAAQAGYAATALAAATVVSLLSYRLVERPSNTWLRQQWQRATGPAAA
ncbi:MAG: acyltransferase [Pseudomonadota bacterium]